MDLGLKDKLVFLTGASSGIGAAAARLFAEEGAEVIVSYGHNREGAEATARAVRACDQRAWLFPLDLADPETVAKTLAGLPPEAARLDGLVLCAGLSLHTPFDEIGLEEWNRVLTVNLTGAFFVLQALAPRLRDGSGVVLVSSVSARTGVSHQAHYAAAKAGLVNLTKSAARQFGPRLRVNCVTPGVTLTPMGQETAAAIDPDYARNRMLLQRFAEPEEIARLIVFLASPANSFMTGATVDANGGRELF